MVTWQSDTQDGSQLGAFGQAYDGGGNRVGSEFQINSYTDLDQNRPVVTGLADGFVVAWHSDGQDGDGFGVFGQRYTNIGAPIGTEFQINSTTASTQDLPAIASISDGGFVVTWTSFAQSASADVYGQRFDSNGDPVGIEFQVNSTTAEHQDWSDVNGLTDGGFVVTWQSNGQDGDLNGVYGQRFDSAGTPSGGEFQINTHIDNEQRYPVVTGLIDGGFVVAWDSMDQDGSNTGVYGQIFDVAGNPDGAEFRINTLTYDGQRLPAITATPDGGFVVVWGSDFQDDSGQGVLGQVYDASGTPVGNEIEINRTPSGNQYAQVVTTLNDGSFVITWASEDQDGSGLGIYGQRFILDSPGVEAPIDLFLSSTNIYENQANGPIIGTLFTVDPDGIDHHTYEIIDAQSHGASFYIRNGNQIATDTNLDYENPPPELDVTVRVTDQSGLSYDKTFDLSLDHVGIWKFDSEYQVNTQTDSYQGEAAISGFYGDAVVVWRSDNQDGDAGGIYAQKIDHNGQFMDNEFQVNTQTAGNQSRPSIAELSGEGFVVAWLSETGPDIDIQAQIYDGGINPAGNEFTAVSGLGSADVIPVLTSLSDGGFVITWESDDTDQSGIAGQRFDAGGTTVGSQFTVNTTIAGAQNRPAITSLESGGFIVAWNSMDQDGDGQGIFGQRFDAGANPVGSEFQINSESVGTQSQPAISNWWDDSFMVTWQSDQAGNDFDIYAQHFNPDGTLSGSEYLVNSSATAGDQIEPSIQKDGVGLVITWDSYDQDGSGLGVFGQVFNPNSGEPFGEVFQVNSFTSGDQQGSVTAGLWGGFVTVWESDGQDGSDSGIFAQRFAGDYPGNEAPVTVSLSSFNIDENLPAGSTVGTLFVFDHSLGDTHTFSLSGPDAHLFQIVGNELQTTVELDHEAASEHQIIITATDQTGLSNWNDPSIYVNDVSGDVAQPLGDRIQVSAPTANPQNNFFTAGLSNGNYVVSWTESEPDYSVSYNYFRIFDADGNPID